MIFLTTIITTNWNSVLGSLMPYVNNQFQKASTFSFNVNCL